MQRGRSAWRRRLIGAYILLLAGSQLRGMLADPQPELRPGYLSVDLPTIAAGSPQPDSVRLTYRLHPQVDGREAPTLLLLHGSPGGLQDFDALARQLSEHYRVLVPDLPGFGQSRHALPDYSLAAHAHYVEELLERLDLDSVHVVGFSMGGGVAITLAARTPRVASVSLMGSIGVQELELLGDYQLNHLLHGLQLSVIESARWLTPHMGLIDGTSLIRAYARNFYDSDQRPLRGYLQEYSGPMLIVHGREDSLVPVAAALEHHRLVPHSELSLLAGGHLMLWQRPGEVAERLAAFVAKVEAGDGLRRQGAAPERLARAIEPFDPASMPPPTGLALLIVMGLLATATLVSEDLTCIGAGLLVSQGRLGFVPGTLACGVGIFVGDLLLFLAGRSLGRTALRIAPVRMLIDEAAVERASAWFRRRGMAAIFLSRFMPGARLPTYFAAGALKTSLARFSLYFLAAVAVWTPILIGLASGVGQASIAYLARPSLRSLALVAVGLLIVQRYLLRCLTWRGRRLVIGSLRRKLRWEFWPAWVFYPPVVAKVLWLGLRHRSLTLFTAANPGIPSGGFVGESKSDILAGLHGDHLVARFTLLKASATPESRLAAADAFIARNSLKLPVVLKPDVGERGKDVRIIRTRNALEAEVRELRDDQLLQEYVAGAEFGLFYVRMPDQQRGTIFSITDKRLPTVTGDGSRSLEELILSDERAVCMAPTYLKAHGRQADRVPAAAESVELVEIGTHCRGAVFLDGQSQHSTELERALDDLSQRFEGFYFGRYDVRTGSAQELRAGHFRVLELNGVTSEATHIYDPKYRLLDAYRVLFRQWELAFAIGRLNRTRGANVTPASGLLRALVKRGWR